MKVRKEKGREGENGGEKEEDGQEEETKKGEWRTYRLGRERTRESK